MNLHVVIKGVDVELLRGKVQIGSFKLDEHGQISGIDIHTTAMADEAEKIIRLAASHVAQFVVERSRGFTLQETLRPTTPPKRERSTELLNFGAIAPQQAHLSVKELEWVMGQYGVKVERR